MACASAETAAVKLAGEGGGDEGSDSADADKGTPAAADAAAEPTTPPPSAQTLNHSSLQYSSHAACAFTPLVSSGWSSGSPPGDMWNSSASNAVALENRPACASCVELHPAATAAARGTLRRGAAAATQAQAMVETRTATGVRRRAGAAPSARTAAARAGLGGGGWGGPRGRWEEGGGTPFAALGRALRAALRHPSSSSAAAVTMAAARESTASSSEAAVALTGAGGRDGAAVEGAAERAAAGASAGAELDVEETACCCWNATSTRSSLSTASESPRRDPLGCSPEEEAEEGDALALALAVALAEAAAAAAPP